MDTFPITKVLSEFLRVVTSFPYQCRPQSTHHGRKVTASRTAEQASPRPSTRLTSSGGRFDNRDFGREGNLI